MDSSCYLVAISCVLLFGLKPLSAQYYLSFGPIKWPAAVDDLQSEVTSYFGLREVNRDLQLRNGELEMEVINLKEQLNRYRSSVGKDTIPFDSVLHDYDFAVARVVNNSVAQINNYITIDKGRAEGIEPGDGSGSIRTVSWVLSMLWANIIPWPYRFLTLSCVSVAR